MQSFVQTGEAGRLASDSVQSSCYLRGPRACRPCLAACRANIAGGTEIGGRSVGAIGVVNDAAALAGLDVAVVDDPFEGRSVAAAVATSRPRPGTDRGRGARQAGVPRSTPDRGIIPQRDAGAASPLVDAAERPARRARAGRFGRIAFAFGPEEATPVERIEAH